MSVELGTVSHGSSVLSVSLNRALETFSFGNRRRVDLVAGRENVSLDLILYGILFRVVKLQFADKSLVGNASLVKMAL